MRYKVYDALRDGDFKLAIELIEEWHAVNPHPALERAHLICIDGLEFHRGYPAIVRAYDEVQRA